MDTVLQFWCVMLGKTENKENDNSRDGNFGMGGSMDQASSFFSSEIPKAEKYFSMTENEKDIELGKSIMRLRHLMYRYQSALTDALQEGTGSQKQKY